MPSLSNFQKMEMKKLREVLRTAYQKQLEQIVEAKAKDKQYDKQTEEQIEKSLNSKISKLTRYMWALREIINCILPLIFT